MNEDLKIMNYELRIRNSLFSILVFLFFQFSFSQVTTSVDTTQIKIGEQINFKIQVDADTTAQVIFPKANTFSPLEVIDSSAVDTFRKKDKYQLIKKYALTQFDSGTYTLPKQQILINNKPFFTDSLLIEVANVAVDTTKQKMYDIKPIVTVEKVAKNYLKYILIAIAILVILAVLSYFLFFRKKPPTEAEKIAMLPPYDRALLALKELETSKYLIQSQYKQYYSELTDIIRSYLEEEIHIDALESTTNELINRLELLKDSGKLNLEDDTIKQFKNVLQTADLVKFAKSKPQTQTAETDRKTIATILKKTKTAIPEPTEEEIQETAAYQELVLKKRRKRNMVITISVSVLAIMLTTGGLIWYYGYEYAKDSVLGHPTKELLDGEWVYSEYGFPVISLETPKVLKRIKIPSGENTNQNSSTEISKNDAFYYGSMLDRFYILVRTTHAGQLMQLIKQKMPSENVSEQEIKAQILQTIAQGAIGLLEQQGATNIIYKTEDYNIDSTLGIKAYGSFTATNAVTNAKMDFNYQFYFLIENQETYTLIFTYQDNDTYAEPIIEKVLSSVSFKTKT